jgi:hypothetical protein
MTHGTEVEHTNTVEDVATKVFQLNGVHVSLSSGPGDKVEHAMHPFGRVNFGQAVS